MININYDRFYFEKLNSEQKKLYLELENFFKLNDRCFPCVFDFANLTAEEFSELYLALYLDMPILPIIPYNQLNIKLIQSLSNSDKIELTSKMSMNITREQMQYICDLRRLYNLENDKDIQHRDTIIKICFYLYKIARYQILNNNFGESPYDIIFQHRGYCTGFSRTLKAIFPKCVCVRGKLKRDFSSISNIENRYDDIPHIWNAIYDDQLQKWIFFDPTSCVCHINAQVNDELNHGFYRFDYSNANFNEPIFYDLESLKNKYVLEDERLWY